MLLLPETGEEHQYFSPPSKALMNVLQTPQLNFSESIQSSDYRENESRAQFGFAPNESIYSGKFRIETD